MGNSQHTNNQPQYPPQPINPIMNSIYNTNTQSFPQHPNYPQRNYNPPITSTQNTPLRLDSFIDKSTVNLIQVSPTIYNIVFLFSSSVNCQINIHYFATEAKEGETCYMKTDTRTYPEPLLQNFYPGKNQQFNSAPIDLSLYSPTDLFSTNHFPITIEIFPMYPDARP